jgi:hypothetical protein
MEPPPVLVEEFGSLREEQAEPRCIRQCHATLLLQQGVHAKIVEERLGLV